MPRDQAGAPAPLSPLAQRLETLQRCRRRDGRKNRKSRRFYIEKLQMLEHLLARVIDGADFIAEVRLPLCPSEIFPTHTHRDRPGVSMLVTLTARDFADLCCYGADVEDMEPDEEGGPSLGSTEEASQQDQRWWSDGGPYDMECAVDDEPSLGSPDGILNQERWHSGSRTDEEPDCDRERDIDNAQVRAAERVAAGKPEDGPDTIRDGKGRIFIRRGRWGEVNALDPQRPIYVTDEVRPL